MPRRQILDLADDLSLGRLFPEHGGEGDDEDEVWREGKDRVERERRAESWRAILVPLEEPLSEKRPDDTRRE